MSRQRMTWTTQSKKASPPPQIPAVDRTEKGDHPAHYPDPEFGDFAKGDPDAWAETPNPPPYPQSAPPNMPGNFTTEEPDHPAWPDLEIMPPSTPVTAKEASLYRQAALCQYIATKLLEQRGVRVASKAVEIVERKTVKKASLSPQEEKVAKVLTAIERKAVSLMSLPYEDLLRTAKTLDRAIPQDSPLAVSAKRDFAAFNKLVAEEEEKDDAEDEDAGKQAFFDEILAEGEGEDEEEEKDETASKKASKKPLRKRAEDEEKEEKKDEEETASKKASKLKRSLEAALALLGEEDEEEDKEETASKKAEEEDEKEKEKAEDKKAFMLLARLLRSAEEEKEEEDKKEEEETASKKASKKPVKPSKSAKPAKKASERNQLLALLSKMAEEEVEEEEVEEEDEDEDDEESTASKKKAAKAAHEDKILTAMEQRVAELEKRLTNSRGKRADALEVGQNPFAEMVDDDMDVDAMLYGEDMDGDGIDQNDPTYGYTTAEDRMLLAALTKLERRAGKKSAQKKKTAVEAELSALLAELTHLAEEEDSEEEEKEEGKSATEVEESVAPRNPNADSGAGGNVDPEPAPVTPQVSGPMTGGTAVASAEETACPEDEMMMEDIIEDPMNVMDLGLEEGNALDSAMMDVDPQDLVDFELMAEEQAPQRQAGQKTATKQEPKLRPQPKKASTGPKQIGRVASPQPKSGEEVDELSQLWGNVADVRDVFGMPKTY